MSNCDYNCVKQLSEKLTFLWRIDQYIKDAKKQKHKACQKMWESIKKDEEKHVKMLKSHLVKKAPKL